MIVTGAETTPASEAEVLARFFREVNETRSVHYLPTWGECEDYVTGDCVALHPANVTCQDCLEWVHA